MDKPFGSDTNEDCDHNKEDECQRYGQLRYLFIHTTPPWNEGEHGILMRSAHQGRVGTVTGAISNRLRFVGILVIVQPLMGEQENEV